MVRSEDIKLLIVKRPEGLHRKRKSVTDSMTTVQEKLLSGVDRQLIAFEDRGDEWVAVPGPKGHCNYIYRIRERLKADRFQFRDGEWRKSKAVAPERAIGLSDAETARSNANKAKALKIRADKDREGSEDDSSLFVYIDGVTHLREDLEETGMS